MTAFGRDCLPEAVHPISALRRCFCSLLLTEADKENVFHMTKDTSGVGRGDNPQFLPSLPATQVCFEEPQPSTSTTDLILRASTSSMEPAPAGRVPLSSSGEMGIRGGLRGFLFTNHDLYCYRDTRATKEFRVASGYRLSVVRFLSSKYSCSLQRNAEGQGL